MMDQEFLNRLLATFKMEAEEHLKTISTGLIKFEKCDDSSQKESIIEPVYRAAHSLKGAARAVELLVIERLCQNIENVFSALKKEELKESAALFDNLHQGTDLITSYLESKNDLQKFEISNQIEDIINNLTEHLVIDYQEPPDLPSIDKSRPAEIEKISNIIDKSEVTPGSTKTKDSTEINVKKKEITSESIPSSETVRISTTRLDHLLLQGEEMLSTKLLSEELTRNINSLDNYFEKWKREIEKVNTHIRNEKAASISHANIEKPLSTEDNVIARFIEWNQTYLKELNEEIRSLAKYSQNNNYTFSKMINRFIVDLKEILLLPFSHIWDMFPKLVRDIARDMGKEIDVDITGSDAMIDRRILEEIKDPFIHLIRNSVDHGIEAPNKRIELGKDRRGIISIRITPAEGNKIEVAITDDGQGIDINKIKKTAINQELVTETGLSNMSEEQILSLIFESGISTSKKVTDISGRGLGMAIVKENVEKLGGNIKINTELNSGTTIKIYLPLTLTTFRGIVIKCSKKLFVIQTMHVKNVTRIKASGIKTIENKETILINNIPVALVFLSEILGINGRHKITEDEYVTVVIISSADKNIAFAVDEIVNEQEILLKQFNYQLVKVRNIAGATILGNGKVVPLLDINDLIKSAEKPAKEIIPKSIEPKKEIKLLVVDDSITSRTLIKDILESAGYLVDLAIDGLDALAKIKSTRFDLIVSDVEMPGMDGFRLTKEVRDIPRLSTLPVVLVTALANKEHREKGMEAGANAYIVKSSFDQSDLLSIIKRLV